MTLWVYCPSVQPANTTYSSKGIVFFFSREKFENRHFWEKIEWVSQFFFFRLCFFFRPLRSSEWVGYKLFLGKKNTHFCWKKKTLQKCKSTCFSGGAVFLPSEWLSNFSWEKKIQLYFFSKNGKKKTKISENEWVSGVKLFPEKKKYDTFGETMLIKSRQFSGHVKCFANLYWF